jgi:hypothetical protein
MKTQILIIAALIAVVFTVSCKKEELPELKEKNILSFNSLSVEKAVIGIKEETVITATATGSELKYQWKASAGKIIGSGANVIFAGSHCCMGVNEITCTVTDSNGKSISKSTNIEVK